MSYFEPAIVEEELEQRVNRDIHVDPVIFVALLRVQKLSTDQAKCKKRINCDGDYL